MWSRVFTWGKMIKRRDYGAEYKGSIEHGKPVIECRIWEIEDEDENDGEGDYRSEKSSRVKERVYATCALRFRGCGRADNES